MKVPMLFRKIAILLLCLAAGSAAFAASSCDAILGRKKINIVVPFKAGGGYDSYARMLAPLLQEATGARVAVSNLSGANGVSGMKAIASAPPESITLGVFDLRDLLAARITDPSLPSTGDFVALGSFGATVGVWAARSDSGPLLDGQEPLAIGVSTGVLARILLPAKLLGKEVKLVRGYLGLSERWLALLRGDVDVTDGSIDSISRFISTSPGTRAVLILADAPSAEFPATPYLGGPGGLVDLRTRKLDAATRRETMELASLAVELSMSTRTVTIARTAPIPVRACMETAVEQVLFGPALREVAMQQKLPVQPLRGEKVREQLAGVESAMTRNQLLLKRLAAAP